MAVDLPRLKASRMYTAVLSILKRVYVDTYRDYGRQDMFVLMESNMLIAYGMVKENYRIYFKKMVEVLVESDGRSQSISRLN